MAVSSRVPFAKRCVGGRIGFADDDGPILTARFGEHSRAGSIDRPPLRPEIVVAPTESLRKSGRSSNKAAVPFVTAVFEPAAITRTDNGRNGLSRIVRFSSCDSRSSGSDLARSTIAKPIPGDVTINRTQELAQAAEDEKTISVGVTDPVPVVAGEETPGQLAGLVIAES